MIWSIWLKMSKKNFHNFLILGKHWSLASSQANKIIYLSFLKKYFSGPFKSQFTFCWCSWSLTLGSCSCSRLWADSMDSRSCRGSSWTRSCCLSTTSPVGSCGWRRWSIRTTSWRLSTWTFWIWRRILDGSTIRGSWKTTSAISKVFKEEKKSCNSFPKTSCQHPRKKKNVQLEWSLR